MDKIEIVSYLVKSGRIEEDKKDFDKGDQDKAPVESDSKIKVPRVKIDKEELRVIKSV